MQLNQVSLFIRQVNINKIACVLISNRKIKIKYAQILISKTFLSDKNTK